MCGPLSAQCSTCTGWQLAATVEGAGGQQKGQAGGADAPMEQRDGAIAHG